MTCGDLGTPDRVDPRAPCSGPALPLVEHVPSIPIASFRLYAKQPSTTRPPLSAYT